MHDLGGECQSRDLEFKEPSSQPCCLGRPRDCRLVTGLQGSGRSLLARPP